MARKCKCGKPIKSKRLDAKYCSRYMRECAARRALGTERMKRYRNNHREKMREIGRKRLATGTDAKDDIYFYGYKEPLRKFDIGYGYKGVLAYSKSKDMVQCHFCGRFFRALNNGHLDKVHQLTAAEYKEQVGLSRGTALIGEGTREKFLKRPYNPNHMEELLKAQELRRERKRKGLPDKQGCTEERLERKNKKGTCPDQLLKDIKDLRDYLRRTPSFTDYDKMYPNKIGILLRTFGTWKNAVKMAGYTPVQDEKSEAVSKPKLLEYLRMFYKVNKRPPHYSDFKRGILPNSSFYYKHFKNLNEARQQAGIPVIINLGWKRYEYVKIKQNT